MQLPELIKSDQDTTKIIKNASKLLNRHTIAPWSNLQYYADRGFHVESADREQATLIKTGVISSYHDVPQELLCKMSMVCLTKR